MSGSLISGSVGGVQSLSWSGADFFLLFSAIFLVDEWEAEKGGCSAPRIHTGVFANIYRCSQSCVLLGCRSCIDNRIDHAKT